MTERTNNFSGMEAPPAEDISAPSKNDVRGEDIVDEYHLGQFIPLLSNIVEIFQFLQKERSSFSSNNCQVIDAISLTLKILEAEHGVAKIFSPQKR